MRRISLSTGLAFWLISALWPDVGYGQQTSEDQRVAVYRQLLTESNDRLATALSQVSALQAEIAKTKTELDKTKTELDKKKLGSEIK